MVDNYIRQKDIVHKVFLLNKPPRIISSCKDNMGRKTVLDILPLSIRHGLYPIGRLDMKSRGAISPLIMDC